MKQKKMLHWHPLKPITLSFRSIKSDVTPFHELGTYGSHNSGADFFILFESNDKLLHLNVYSKRSLIYPKIVKIKLIYEPFLLIIFLCYLTEILDSLKLLGNSRSYSQNFWEIRVFIFSKEYLIVNHSILNNFVFI